MKVYLSYSEIVRMFSSYAYQRDWSVRYGWPKMGWKFLRFPVCGNRKPDHGCLGKRLENFARTD